MVKRTSIERVEVLEQKVAKLEELPSEVAALRAEFVQFRAENSAEHSVMRQEFRDQLHAKFDEARRHSLVLHEHLVDLIKRLGTG